MRGLAYTHRPCRRSDRSGALRRRPRHGAEDEQRHARPGSTVWHGKLEAPYRGEVTLAAVDNALAGSVTLTAGCSKLPPQQGLHEVREVIRALLPTEDPPLQPDLVSSSGSATVSDLDPPAWQMAQGRST